MNATSLKRSDESRDMREGRVEAFSFRIEERESPSPRCKNSIVEIALVAPSCVSIPGQLRMTYLLRLREE